MSLLSALGQAILQIKPAVAVTVAVGCAFLPRIQCLRRNRNPGRDTLLARENDERSQRAQEVQNVLLLAGGEKLVEDRLHSGGFSTVALMCLDSAEQVAATTVVQEEDALS